MSSHPNFLLLHPCSEGTLLEGIWYHSPAAGKFDVFNFSVQGLGFRASAAAGKFDVFNFSVQGLGFRASAAAR